MKTKEELNTLKEEFTAVSRKLHELSDEELEQVTAGCGAGIDVSDHGVSGIIEKLLETIKKLREKEQVTGGHVPVHIETSHTDHL